MNIQRHGSVLGLRAEKLEEYKQLHREVWPGVLDTIRTNNIRNYSIFLRRLPDGEYYLFSYFEYVGEDFAGDMAAIAADPMTQQWWAVCKPCQKPLPDVSVDEWWAEMEPVFHCA